MKRSVQEIVELLVFGLIALLVGTGLLWLAGWIFDLVGVLFKFFAALIWSLLRFIVPVAVGAAIVYGLVRLIQQQRDKSASEKSRASAESALTTDEPPVAVTDSGSDTPGSTSTTPPPGTPPMETPAEHRPGEGDSHPRASEIWVPPQPSPPTSSSESLDEPGPVGDAGPFEEPRLVDHGEPFDEARPVSDTGPFDEPRPGGGSEPNSSPLDPEVSDLESTGSVPPSDDETTLEERLGGSASGEPETTGDENDEDRRS